MWRGPGASPDYENETLVEALERFVLALGARYDNDTRLGGVQARHRRSSRSVSGIRPQGSRPIRR